MQQSLAFAGLLRSDLVRGLQAGGQHRPASLAEKLAHPQRALEAEH